MYLGVLARTDPHTRVSTCSASTSTPTTPLHVPPNCQTRVCASSYFAIASLVRPCFKCLYDFVPHDCTFRVPSLLTRCLSLRLLWIVKRNFCGLGLANV